MEAGLQEETKVQVRFAAKTGGQDAVDLNIPDTAFAVPDRLTRKGLAEVINGLLSLDPPQRFDFLVNGELLRSSLSTFLTNRNLSKELTIRIDVVRPVSRPTPLPAPELDDWVGCVSPAGSNGLIAAGLYNGAICISRQPGTTEQTPERAGDRGSAVSSAGHDGPIKGVDMKMCGDRYLLVSASQDCSLRCWEYEESRCQAPTCTAVCEGHAAAVDCVSFEHGPCGDSVRFASGSWDKTVKLWEIEPSKSDPQKSCVNLPAASMDGHTQAVSCLCWPAGETIYRNSFTRTDASPVATSGSYDHTIRVWDASVAASSRTIFGSKRVVSCIAYSGLSQRIATGHHDRRVRLWDPKAPETAMQGEVLGAKGGGSHNGWVTAVAWCPTSEYHLTSCAMDGELKVWDTRALVPLHTIKAHADKALCVSWLEHNLLVTGGADSKLQFYTMS